MILADHVLPDDLPCHFGLGTVAPDPPPTPSEHPLTTLLAPYLFALVLLAMATLLGILPVRKLIQVREAKHELKHGSAGFLRTMSGWVVIALWIMATWFFATILGDWATYGNLEDALDRAVLRLYILLEIAAALGDN